MCSGEYFIEKLEKLKGLDTATYNNLIYIEIKSVQYTVKTLWNFEWYKYIYEV